MLPQYYQNYDAIEKIEKITTRIDLINFPRLLIEGIGILLSVIAFLMIRNTKIQLK